MITGHYIHAVLIISMTKLDNSQCQHHILSAPKLMQSCQTFNQNVLLLFVFSFSYFALSFSRAISFAILFVLGKSLIVHQHSVILSDTEFIRVGAFDHQFSVVCGAFEQHFCPGSLIY